VEFVDTHCHLDFNKFDHDRIEVIQRAQAAGIKRILIPGVTIESSRAAVDLALNNPILFAAVGIQPNDSLSWDDKSVSTLKKLALTTSEKHTSGRKIIAIGEIGLDYYWEAAPHDHQKKVLQHQLDLAAELELPVVVHLREKQDVEHGPCTDDLWELLSNWISNLRSTMNPLSRHPGVLHSFSGNLDTALRAIRSGFYIGVTGPVTYSKARNRQDLIRAIPLDHLLLETDSPYLAPQPKRGQRNEPANIPLVAEKISELHGEPLARVAEQTCTNAAILFNW
jgi:TatD DNase family protein